MSGAEEELRTWRAGHQRGYLDDLDRPTCVAAALDALGGLGAVGQYIDILEDSIRGARAALLALTDGYELSGPFGDLICSVDWVEPEDGPDAFPRGPVTVGAEKAKSISELARLCERIVDDLFDALCLRVSAQEPSATKGAMKLSPQSKLADLAERFPGDYARASRAFSKLDKPPVTLAELANLSVADLYRIKGIGRKTVRSLGFVLSSVGLTFSGGSFCNERGGTP